MGALVSEWTVGGTALTSLMDVERRHGKIYLEVNILLFFMHPKILLLDMQALIMCEANVQLRISCSSLSDNPYVIWLVFLSLAFLLLRHSALSHELSALPAGKFKPVIKKAMVDLEGQKAESH